MLITQCSWGSCSQADREELADAYRRIVSINFSWLVLGVWAGGSLTSKHHNYANGQVDQPAGRRSASRPLLKPGILCSDTTRTHKMFEKSIVATGVALESGAETLSKTTFLIEDCDLNSYVGGATV